jgi:GGDEF domain-containing protein
MEDVVDPETGWYQSWYFTARLGDEVTRSLGKKQQLALVYFRLPLRAWSPDNHLRVYLTVRLGLLEHDLANVACFSGRLSEDEFAICLTNVSDSQAEGLLELLWSTLSGLGADAVVLTCPEDGTDATSLMTTAREKLLPSNVVDLKGYREDRYGKAA